VVETIGDAFLRHAGPCYVALGCGLVAMVAHSLLFVVLPLTRDLRTWQGLGTFAAVAFVFFNIGFNYVMSVRVDPGSPTERDVQVVCAEAGAAVKRWCQICRCPKPSLTHHCSVCRRCVLKMDHHCPWIHNCVGHRNYRNFFNFLFWLWCGCLVTVWHTGAEATGDRGIVVVGARAGGGPAAISEPPEVRDRFVETIGPPSLGVAGMHRRDLNRDERSAALFSCILAFSVFLALCFLWFWHVYLVLTAQTSVDYHRFAENRKAFKKRGETYVNPHDQGWRRNWQEAFDERGKYWWFAWAAPRLKPHGGTGVPVAAEA
jgi:palmitoyltransferase